MRGVLTVGMFLLFSLAFLQTAHAQSTPALSVSPLTGLPENAYSFKVTGVPGSASYLESRMTLQFYDKVTGDWKNLAVFDDLIQQSSAGFETSLDGFAIDGKPIVSKYTKVNVDEQFRVLVDRQTTLGVAENKETQTNPVSVRFTALCARKAPTLQITDPSDKILKVPVKRSDQTVQYSVSVKNNDPTKCGTSIFKITKAFAIEASRDEGKIDGVSLNSGTLTVSPGETRTIAFDLKIEGNIDEDTGFNIVAANQRSTDLGETDIPGASARLSVDMVEEEILGCKKVPKVTIVRQSASGTVPPNFPAKLTATIENQNDARCAAADFELTRVGIEPALTTSSEYLSGTLWSVKIPDAYGYEFESSKSAERFDMVSSNRKTLTRYNPVQKILLSLRPGERRTYDIIFLSPVNVLGPDDTNGNRDQNRAVAFCARMSSDNNDVCTDSFVSVKLPPKSDDKTAPAISFAGTKPENPIAGDSVSAHVNATDEYRIKSVKFVVNGDETTKIFSQPRVSATSDAKMTSAGDRYRIEVLDWNDNKVCFPSDCASYANPKFGNYPDPYISSGSISRTSVTSPGELDVTLTVKNRGNVDVADFAFRIYLDNTLVALKSAFDTPLKSGDSDTEIITEDIVIPPEVSEGRHSITAEIVFDGDERDSGNNKRIAMFSVTESASSSTGTTTSSTSASQGAVSETSGDYKLSISTDKESYVEGEKVILSGSLSRSSAAVSGAGVIIVARNDETGISTREFARTTDSIGRFSFVIDSESAPAFGKWGIEASAIGGSVKVSKKITLSSATDTSGVELTVNTNKESYKEGDRVVVSGTSSGSTVSIQAINEEESKRTIVYDRPVSSDGSYSFSFRTEGAALGNWKIVVKNSNGESVEKTVQLSS